MYLLIYLQLVASSAFYNRYINGNNKILIKEPEKPQDKKEDKKDDKKDDKKLRKYMLYFGTSLAYIKSFNMPIVLYTDSKGKEVFKDFPYDEIYTTLDNIPEDINPKFYAYGI